MLEPAWRSNLTAFLKDRFSHSESSEDLRFLGRHQHILSNLGGSGLLWLYELAISDVAQNRWVLGFRACEIIAGGIANPEQKDSTSDFGYNAQVAAILGLPPEISLRGTAALCSWYLTREGKLRERALIEVLDSVAEFIGQLREVHLKGVATGDFGHLATLSEFHEFEKVIGKKWPLQWLASPYNNEVDRPRISISELRASLPQQKENKWIPSRMDVLEKVAILVERGELESSPLDADMLKASISVYLRPPETVLDTTNAMIWLRLGSKSNPFVQYIAQHQVAPEDWTAFDVLGIVAKSADGSKLLSDVLAVVSNAHNMLGDLRFPYIEGSKFPPFIQSTLLAYLTVPGELLSAAGDTFFDYLIRQNREVSETVNGKEKRHEPLTGMLSNALDPIVKTDGTTPFGTLLPEETALIHFALGELATSKASTRLAAAAKKAANPFLQATAEAAKAGMPTRRNMLAPRRRMDHATAFLHVVNRSRQHAQPEPRQLGLVLDTLTNY